VRRDTHALLLKSYLCNNFPKLKVFGVSWHADLIPETSYQKPLSTLIDLSPNTDILDQRLDQDAGIKPPRWNTYRPVLILGKLKNNICEAVKQLDIPRLFNSLQHSALR
jgi:hypothetical protein